MSKIERIRLLVVDDEDAIRRSLAEYLEDFDFEVDEADSGEEAIKRCQGNKYDAAIVDLRLPGITGDSLIDQLHQDYPEMKFMIHTGSCEFKVSEELLKIGISQNQIILKPVTDLNNLVERIRDFVGKRL